MTWQSCPRLKSVPELTWYTTLSCPPVIQSKKILRYVYWYTVHEYIRDNDSSLHVTKYRIALTNHESSNSNNELLEQQKGLWYHQTLCMFSLIHISSTILDLFQKYIYFLKCFSIKTIFGWISYRERSVDLWSDVGHTITGCSLHRTVWLGLQNVCNGSIQQGNPKFSHLKKNITLLKSFAKYK